MGRLGMRWWGIFYFIFFRTFSLEADSHTAIVGSLQDMSAGFAALTAEVKPGVVAIATEQSAREVVESPFFPRGMRPRERSREGAGSGVIVPFNGKQYVLTNNHVVHNADNIRVELSDSRFFEAEVVGTDSLSDIAVLKLDAADLPQVGMGDSDDLQEGELVLAIGNPFGIAHSISMGIVSGLGRGRSREEYGSYIQTDAAINPGNSGGALVNVQGELVGINAAIVSGGGGGFGRVGNVGIGFAIPINQVKFVMSELIEHGEVRRGLLGVQIRDLSPLMAEAMGLATKDGVLISEVIDGGAADKAGVEDEDVVLEIDGRKIHDSTELKSIIGRTPPGTEIELLLLRDGDKKRISVSLDALTEDTLALARGNRGAQQNEAGRVGLAVQELTSELSSRLGYREGVEGILISGVRSGSEADRRGLRRGMLITGVNRFRVTTVKEYKEALEDIAPGEAFMLRVRDRNEKGLMAMRMPKN
ncbi:MAG: Do family serine endopeptidase [Candidatus Latescibacterota bacterium]|nr:Do family serine endopeptidase [Candidatus Latescibacterota bacterium]